MSIYTEMSWGLSTHSYGDEENGAMFSPCKQYRYALWRTIAGGSDREFAMLGLNPSTADHRVNDPTVTRCINRARDLGYGKFWMLNLFAWRDTDPKGMKAAIEPVGIENDQIIRMVVSQCEMVVCAWGAHGKYKGRADAVLKLLSDYDLHALKITKGGFPQHPLYLPNKLQPTLWRAKS
jgi:hypothetical protein